jgi:hypothetical protein
MPIGSRLIALSLLAVLALTGAESATEPVAQAAPASATTAAWTLDPADKAEITRLLDAAVAHGFPNVAGAAVYAGDLRFDAEILNAFSPGAYGGRGEQIVGIPTACFDGHGLHLKLADGSWLVGLALPAPAAQVDAAGHAPLTLAEVAATLRQEAGADADFAHAEQQAALWLQGYPPAAHPALRTSLRWWLLRRALGLRDSLDFDAALLHLVRLGVPQSDGILVLLALDQAHTLGDPASEAAAPLLLSGADRDRFRRVQQGRFLVLGAQNPMRQRHVLDPLPVVVAQTLHRWFRARLVRPDPRLTAQQALDGMQAVLIPGMAGEMREQTWLFAARAALPAKRPADASLALRVALWNPPDPQMNLSFAVGTITELTDDQLAAMPPHVRDFVRQAKEVQANAFTLRDLGALIALSGDASASCWLDGDLGRSADTRVVRTVGDNALRILAHLLHVDPRVLIHRDPLEPWTPQASAATASALQAWWRDHAQQSLGEALATVVPTLDIGAAARLTQALPQAERAPLIGALVAQWREHPPLRASAGELAEALTVLGDEPAVGELVAALPVSGVQRLVLATWRARHGDGQALDALLTAALAAEEGPEALVTDPDNAPEAVLAITLHLPSATRLGCLFAALASDPTAPGARRVFDAACEGGATPAPAMTLLRGTGQANRLDGSDATVVRALLLALLNDQRPLPPTLISVERGRLHLHLADGTTRLLNTWPGGEHTSGGQLNGALLQMPADARICDVAGYVARGTEWHWGLPSTTEKSTAFPLNQPRVTRDAALATLRTQVRALVEDAFTAADLPLSLLPEVGIPAKPAAKSEF